MSKQMIENSERGITLNKTLAWTILVAVLSGGFWIGVQITSAKTGISTLTERQSEDRGAIQSNRSSINDLRSSSARIDQRLRGIENSLSKTEANVSEILRYLREPQFRKLNEETVE
jgi:septal ring factor EnvC (AmiA/AmiB activator)